MKTSALLIVIFLAPVIVHGQTNDDLVGTWKLVSAWTTKPSGQRVPDYGNHPMGFLTYTREGRMTVVVADGDRRPLSGDRLSAPAAERAEAFSNSLAYAGRFTLQGDRIVHHVEVATVANWVNTDQTRRVKLQGNQLTLSTSTTLGGEQRVVELVWRRLK